MKMSDKEEPPEAGGGASVKFHFPQPSRDPQSNWEVDLSKVLEEYLFKICSGEEASTAQPVNFSEAAMLLQQSAHIYSLKVDYLYSLVQGVLEFISQKSQDQEEEDSNSRDDAAIDEEDEVFLGLDDVPVDPKNSLDDRLDRLEFSNHFVKAPANLLVLEGDCLHTSGGANELESCLLANCCFYEDFLLLDRSDAGEIDNFLKRNNAFNNEQERASDQSSTSGRPKNHESSFHTPIRSEFSFLASTEKGPSSPYQMKDVIDDSDSDSDEDEDLWKPLNPSEPGNLRIKPFRKVTNLGVQTNSKSNSKIRTQFPLATLKGIISQEFAKSYEVKVRLKEAQDPSKCFSLYEELRASLSLGSDTPFYGSGDDDQEIPVESNLPDFDHSEHDMGIEVQTNQEKQDMDGAKEANGAGPSSFDDLYCKASFEDDLNALLASIAETEEQKTDFAARVSTWKQPIEQSLKDEEEHLTFNVHQYCDRILDELSLQGCDFRGVPFNDIVVGLPKYEICRTFSAMLHLVNNGSVDLQRPSSSGEPVCHTAENPFHIKLLHANTRKVQVNTSSLKKRMPSPSGKLSDAGSPLKLSPSFLNSHTPDGKRRRRRSV